MEAGMRSIGVARRILLGLLAAAGVAGCSAISTPHPVASVLNQPVTRTASGPASSATAKPSASATGDAIQNLVLSTAVRSELGAEFAAVADIPPSYVLGAKPGSIYYAYEPATDTYWAMATFEESATALKNDPAGFQDGGNVGLFWRVGTGAWHGGLGGIPLTCAELRFFPKGVLAAWSLPTSPPAGMDC
jgi:hypothetical protein